jgi:hypothetical protein
MPKNKKTNINKRVITVCIDSDLAEWLHKRYDGTSKKSWFVNEAISSMIRQLKMGLEIKHRGNDGI